MVPRQETVTVKFSTAQKITASIVTAIIIGLLFWNARSQVRLEKQLAVMEMRITHLEESIRNGMDDRYRGTQARADMKALDDKSLARDAIQGKEITAIQRELDALEKRVTRMEEKR